MSKAEFITSVTLAGRREMDLAADVAKEKFVQKIIDFEKVPSVSVTCNMNHSDHTISYCQYVISICTGL